MVTPPNRHKVGFNESSLEEETQASGDETAATDFDEALVAVRTLKSTYTSKTPIAGYSVGSDLE